MVGEERQGERMRSKQKQVSRREGLSVLPFFLYLFFCAICMQTETVAEAGSTYTPEASETSVQQDLLQNLETDAEADPETGKETEPETDPNTDPDAGRLTEPESNTEANQETDPETGQETETDIRPGSEENEKWLVYITDIRPDIPEGGRVYDGTDQISLSYSYYLRRQGDPLPEGEGADAEERKDQAPPVRVSCSARLDKPDAGRRKVLYHFTIELSDPSDPSGLSGPSDLPESSAPSAPLSVFRAEDDPDPELFVMVRKKELSVYIPDGKKVYAEKADMDHIWPDDAQILAMNRAIFQNPEGKVPKDQVLTPKISGFVEDEEGEPIVPGDFVPPDIDVDPEVLTDDSPMYKEGRETVYRRALVMKRNKDGSLSGNPTHNYVFCEDPENPACRFGDVRVTARLAKEGVDYTITGDRLIRQGGLLIAAYGSSILVQTAKDSPFTTGFWKSQIVSSETDIFRLKAVGESGELLAVSLPLEAAIQVDQLAPQVYVRAEGGIRKNGMLFTEGDFGVILSAGNDDLSGTSEVRYRLLKGEKTYREDGQLQPQSQWVSIPAAGESRISLDREGIWQVEAEAVDMVGNRSFSKSDLLVIDRQAPLCTISGVRNESANSGEVRLKCTCEDPWYSKGSAHIEIRPVSGGAAPSTLLTEESDTGAKIILDDFTHSRDADAIYTAIFTAKDLSGNTGEARLIFSVNRFGSEYSLSDETSEEIRTYYHKKPFDVTFEETNLDDIKSAQILIMKNGEKVSRAAFSVEGPSVLEDGRKRYRYIVPAQAFAEEGLYEVLLVTRDQAGNMSDSGIRQIPVKFAVDGEKPECLVSGIRKNEVYRAGEVTAVFEVRDNLAMKYAEVYLDSRLQTRYDAGQIRKAGGVFKVKIKRSDTWRRLQIHTEDRAGNETWTDEYPLFVAGDKEQVPEYEGTKTGAGPAAEHVSAMHTSKETQTETDVPQDTLPENRQAEAFEDNPPGQDRERKTSDKETAAEYSPAESDSKVEPSSVLILTAGVLMAAVFLSGMLLAVRRKEKGNS